MCISLSAVVQKYSRLLLLDYLKEPILINFYLCFVCNKYQMLVE